MVQSFKDNPIKSLITAAVLLAFAALFAPFYIEILLAAIFALAIEPLVVRLLQIRFLQKRWLKRRGSIALFFAVALLGVLGPLSLVVYKAYSYLVQLGHVGIQNTELFARLSKLREEAMTEVSSRLQSMGLENTYDISQLGEGVIPKIGAQVLQTSTNIVYKLPDILLSTFVFGLVLYFFLVQAERLRRAFFRLGFLSDQEGDKLISILQNSCYSTVITSIVLGLLQATVVSVGALIFSAGDFSIIFVITFIGSFIPVLGAGPIAFTLGLYQLLIGEGGGAMGLFVVALIAGVMDNIIRPYILSGAQDAELPPVVALLALIGALLIFGMPGLFLGPVIASMAVQIVPALHSDKANSHSTGANKST